MPESTSKYSNYKLDAIGDPQDTRDIYYEPDLVLLDETLPVPDGLTILNQGQEGSCTGFGLAAVINLLLQRKNSELKVSTRMLYEMAKRFDRWDGEEYEGSSCRGAILGWYNMGVCSDDIWPYEEHDQTYLNLQRALDARNTTIGAFYRLHHRIADVHAALKMVGVIYASADIHEGWFRPSTQTSAINYDDEVSIGGHAFAIVGYNNEGFFVQNSWGTGWGDNGVALWKYEDWQENVKDMWVARLALSTPQIFSSQASGSGSNTSHLFSKSKKPIRANIAGHFVHLDDGHFDDKGKYWSNLNDIKETTTHIANKEYKHVLLYAHGGLNSIGDSARRISAMKSTFKKNGVYPFHFMYDTGILEEIKDVVIGKKNKASERAMGFSDFTDKLIENLARKPGRAIWNEMKSDARLPFKDDNYAGFETVFTFLNTLDLNNTKIHIAGHSTGAILLAHLLNAMERINGNAKVESCHLMAPACSMDVYKEKYLPLLNNGSINKMRVYNLSATLEKDDNVAQVYRKSLLYLVSNSFESKKSLPLLGMQKFVHKLEQHEKPENLTFLVSEGKSSKNPTESTSHGGFDNDPTTMNDILSHVVDGNVKVPFTKKSLTF